METVLEKVPGASDRLHAMEWLIRNSSNLSETNPELRSSTLVVPVVVHVIHNGGNENISSNQIQNAITLLNEAFENVGSYAYSGGTATGIQFCLAKRDPQGNPSNGINRIQSPLTNFTREIQDAQIKALSQWPSHQYLNIWIAREINSQSVGIGIAGYATMPFLHGDPGDGIVLEARHFGVSAEETKVLVHEAGHYLGLYHTFEGGCANSDCQSQGDRVCDTPPDASTASSLAAFNSCNSDEDDVTPVNPFRPTNLGGLGDQLDQIDNFMDYGRLDVLAKFTFGQRTRMRQSLINFRQSLLATNACESPCVTTVIASFSPSSPSVTIGDTVFFSNQSIGGNQFEWSVDGTVFSNGNAPYLVLTQPGVYIVRLLAGNGQGGCENAYEEEIEVQCDALADFTNTNTNVFVGGSVTFTSTAQNATQSVWLLDGQPVSVQPTYTQTFTQAGVHTVQLVATSGNCFDSSRVEFVDVGSCGAPVHTMNWAFGDSTSLVFQSGTGLPNGQTGISTIEGSASYSDNSGNLLFYTDGNSVWNKNHLSVGNGQGLMGHKSSSQGVIALPMPGSTHKYYIFTADALETGFFAGLRYSILDMGLLNGVGAIPANQKNVPLAPMNSEMITAVQKDNGEDFWLLTHQAFSSNFRAFEITAAGISPNPVVSTIGPTFDLPTGYMRVSPDRQKVAVACNKSNWRGLAIVDFDPVTGGFSNLFQIPVPVNEQVYGVEFSPDGSKLYFTTFYHLYQVDLSLGTQQAIINSKTTLHSVNTLQLMALQRGLDGKIYVAGGPFSTLHTIEEPNAAGPACNFQWASIGMNGPVAMWGLPNFFLGLPKGVEPVEMEGVDNVCESGDPVWFGAKKSSNTDQLLWDAQGGAIQQISGDTLAGVVFSQAGPAEVIVERSSQCGITRDTIEVNVKAAPASSLGNDTLLCNGASIPLVACPSANCDVLWSTGSTAQGLIATAPQTLSVRIESQDACVTMDTIVVDSFSLLPMNVDLGADTSICDGGVVLLEAEPGPYRQYLWQDGSQQVFHSAVGPGVYSVQVTDVCGGYAIDSIKISDSSPNILYLGPDQQICPGDTLELVAGADFVYQEWQDGSTGEQLYATTPGTYHLEATTYGGCIVRDTIELLPCMVAVDDVLDELELSLYPNPNNGVFHLALPGLPAGTSLELVLYDGLGRVVHSEITDDIGMGNGMRVQVPGLANGIYHLELRSESHNWHASLEILSQ